LLKFSGGAHWGNGVPEKVTWLSDDMPNAGSFQPIEYRMIKTISIRNVAVILTGAPSEETGVTFTVSVMRDGSPILGFDVVYAPGENGAKSVEPVLPVYEGAPFNLGVTVTASANSLPGDRLVQVSVVIGIGLPPL
jgi:hypothetical protein